MPFKRLMSELDKEVPDIKAIDEILRHYPSLISKLDEEEGLTPILLAAFKGNHDLVKHLMTRGAKLTEKTNYKETAFMMAAGFGDMTLAQLAIKHGVDPLAKDNEGCDALSYAENFLEQIQEKYKALLEVFSSLSAFSAEYTTIKDELQSAKEQRRDCKEIIRYIKEKIAERSGTVDLFPALLSGNQDDLFYSSPASNRANLLHMTKVPRAQTHPSYASGRSNQAIINDPMTDELDTSTDLFYSIPNSEVKVNQEELVNALKQLKTDWYAQRKQLQNMMFDDQEWQAERKKIQDLKKQHPIPVTGDFPTTVPRIIAEKTMMPREEQHIEQYHALYKNIIHCPKKIMTKILKQISSKKEDTMEEYAAYALLLANKHHLLEQFCQDNSNSDGLSEYISLKITRLRKKDANLPPVTSTVQKLMMHELQEARHTKVEKREKFNRTLPVDLATDDHIKQLVSSGFELIPVSVNLCTASKIDIKEREWPTNHKVVQKNAIIVDANTQKVLGILVNGALSKQDVEPIMSSFSGSEKYLWAKDSRKGMIGNESRNAATKVNEGNQATFGRLNFKKKVNNLSTTSKRAMPLWNKVKPLNKKMRTVFHKYLPTTFQTVMSQTEELRSAGLFMEPNSPFATVTLNLKNPVKAHRDHNYHNYATMLVYEKDGIKSNTLTCFPEWTCTDPISQQQQDIAFQLGNLAVLIADTDYVHYVPEVLTERVSMVWYAYKDLMTPSFLLCEDSDLEDNDYEPDAEPDVVESPAKKARIGAHATPASGRDEDAKDQDEAFERQKAALNDSNRSAQLSEHPAQSLGLGTGFAAMEDEEFGATVGDFEATTADSDDDSDADMEPKPKAKIKTNHSEWAGAAPKPADPEEETEEYVSGGYVLPEGGYVVTYDIENPALPVEPPIPQVAALNMGGSGPVTGFVPPMLPLFSAMQNVNPNLGQSLTNGFKPSLKRKR